MNTAHEYAQANAGRFESELKELLVIPSISTTPEHNADVERAANWLVENMKRIGLQNAQAFPTHNHPIVYGEWLGAGPDAPTVLAYGHYDVQPADQVKDGWNTPPFVPTEQDGKIYARGVMDSKANVMLLLKAAESLLATGGSPVNIKLIFEGDEESLSDSLAAFVAAHHDLLHCDVCAVVDGSMLDRIQPNLSYALRGVVSMELEVFGPQQDLHSGQFGGTVHNPIQALAEIIAQLHNPDGSVAVPGFYDDVLPLDEEERILLTKALPYLEHTWSEVANAPTQWGEADFNLHERIGARPTLEINGIAGGYAEAGFKTVLPAKALAKVSCRLVANQRSLDIYEKVRAYVAQLTPPSVRSEVRLLSTGEPAILDRNSPAVQAAMRAYERSYGAVPFLVREGGSVPIVLDFQRELGAQMVSLPFGYKGGAAHGPNEHIYLDMWHKAIDIMIDFYSEIREMMKP
jgi:acetylornithine deacetylase/succinyl-diaminopimelate desuccinylase-like protein